jgi:hypothetical protein
LLRIPATGEPNPALVDAEVSIAAGWTQLVAALSEIEHT